MKRLNQVGEREREREQERARAEGGKGWGGGGGMGVDMMDEKPQKRVMLGLGTVSGYHRVTGSSMSGT